MCCSGWLSLVSPGNSSTSGRHPDFYRKSVATGGLAEHRIVWDLEVRPISVQLDGGVAIIRKRTGLAKCGRSIRSARVIVAGSVEDVRAACLAEAPVSSRAELPARNLEFLSQLCTEKGLKLPRVAIIQSAMPNAFTFGHIPSDARIVVTDALLETLTPEEVNAVIAHEVGHIVHWDFVVITLASLVPLLLWELYAMLDDESPAASIAAYGAYWVSRYGVLSLSRTREYYADQFAAQVTNSPASLSTALLKIGYGMAQYASVRKAEPKAKKSSRLSRLDGVFGIMGISNAQPSLALCGVTPDEAARVIW